MYAIRSYYVMKKIIIFLFIFSNFILKAQNNRIEKVIIEFNYFKYLDTEYKIDYSKKEINCVLKHKISKNSDTIFSNKTYRFTNKQFKKIKKELKKNIPDSIIHKSESAFDGGGFVIKYYNRITSYNVCYTKLLRTY